MDADAIEVPAPARLVRDFVNTVEWQVDEDEWSSRDQLASWVTTNMGIGAVAFTDDDLRLARQMREGLREVFLVHAGHEPLRAAIDDLNIAAARMPLRLDFDSRGTVRLSSPSIDPAAHALVRILEAVDAAREDGSWYRLKACSRDSCRWAYWDGSRNRSGRWCSMAGCGNFVKMRRRNGAQAWESDALPTAEDGARVARLLDVAARAGVSIKTVSNVVHGSDLVAPATRRRVQAAIDELDYRPNVAARELRAARTRSEATRDR